MICDLENTRQKLKDEARRLRKTQQRFNKKIASIIIYVVRIHLNGLNDLVEIKRTQLKPHN